MENEGRPQLHQHEIAIKRMEKKHPDKAARTNTLINVFNKQALENLSTFTTEDRTVIPYTTIHLAYIPDKRTSHPKRREKVVENPQKKERVIFTGFAVPDKGHPIYPEVFYSLPFVDMQLAKRTGKAIEVTYLCIGQATGLGGIATSEGNKKAKKEGFKPETEQLTPLVEKFLKDKDTEVIFYGVSMGALKAGEACFQLDHPDNKKKVEMINPPRIPGLGKKYQPKIPQIALGYLVEGLLKKRIPELKEEITPSEYTQELHEFFKEKGFHTKDTLRQRVTKERAVYLNIRNIFKNKLHKIKGEEYPFPVHVHTSALDPITFSVAGLKSAWQSESVTEGNVTVEFNMSTHTTNHYPVDMWVEAMDGVSVKRI